MSLLRFCLLTAALAATAAHATTVRVHYATSDSITIRADKAPATWSKGAAATRESAGIWIYTWPDATGDVSFKPALNDDKVSIGGVYQAKAGATVDVYPFFGAPFGKVVVVDKFASPQLHNTRALRVFLPASYGENSAKRYPVLYMHDGQNLFDAKTAAYGVEWGIDETVNRLVATGVMEEVIVVGIDNTPDRIPEYTPCCDAKYGGGKLDAYGAFIVDTVKPYIDKTYRTLPNKENTAIMGSSLGALASLGIAQKYPDLFSKAGAMSGSFWWNDKALITKPQPRVPVKLYLDAGTRDDGLPDTTLMRDALVKQGYQLNRDLLFYTADGGTHNEKSWAARVEKPLAWFFPWGSTKQ
ncbi:MAG: alpha/beta hydrolase-fold protein [Pseudomonadota bacterium]|nr:alpha/beta hydrolase-fold protein [Pseudomonadota bacterium]